MISDSAPPKAADNREDQIESADVLVIGTEQPACDEIRLVIMPVIVGSGHCIHVSLP